MASSANIQTLAPDLCLATFQIRKIKTLLLHKSTSIPSAVALFTFNLSSAIRYLLLAGHWIAVFLG